MILAGWKLYALALGWLITQVAMTPLFAYRLWTRFPGVWPRKLPHLPWRAAGTHLGKGFWVSVGQVAQLLTSNTDGLIIGRVLSPAAVVPYSFTGKLPGVLGNQASMLMHTAAPALCELRTGESRPRVFQALSALNQAMLTFSGLVFCVVVVINHWFVDWWVTARRYGEQYGGMWLTLAILACMVIRHWTTTTAYTVFCFDHQRRISLTNLCDGLVTAGACLAGTLLWGVIGAPIGSIIGACVVSLPMNLYMIAKDTGTTSTQLVRGLMGGWFWRFALLVTGAVAVSLRWSPKSLTEAVAAVAAVTIVYCLVMLPNLLRAPLGIYIRPIMASFHAKFTALQIRFSS
jgi:O-antigen/teichoic acid export membrane protein